jgi:hypothetical protein
VSDIDAWGTTMAKKITRSRPWTKEELRMLKALARKLKRSVDGMYRLASKLVMMGGGRGRKRV